MLLLNIHVKSNNYNIFLLISFRHLGPITQMSEEDANETLYQALERQPGIVFDILDRISGPGGYYPQPGGTTPQWCCCTHCREMPSMVERVC